MSLAQLQYAFDSLNRLYETCHWRKIERYLIPAIRQAAPQADRLLDELGALNRSALGILTSLQARLDDALAHNDAQISEFCDGIEAFCTTLLRQLEKEEGELFAVARRVIGGEDWFHIANDFLRHDAQIEETRRSRRPVLAVAPRAQRPPERALPAAALGAPKLLYR